MIVCFYTHRTKEGKCRPSVYGSWEPSAQQAAAGCAACPLPRTGASRRAGDGLPNPHQHGPPREPNHGADGGPAPRAGPLPGPVVCLPARLPDAAPGAHAGAAPLRPGASRCILGRCSGCRRRCRLPTAARRLQAAQIPRAQLLAPPLLLAVRDYVPALLLPGPDLPTD